MLFPLHRHSFSYSFFSDIQSHSHLELKIILHAHKQTHTFKYTQVFKWNHVIDPYFFTDQIFNTFFWTFLFLSSLPLPSVLTYFCPPFFWLLSFSFPSCTLSSTSSSFLQSSISILSFFRSFFNKNYHWTLCTHLHSFSIIFSFFHQNKASVTLEQNLALRHWPSQSQWNCPTLKQTVSIVFIVHTKWNIGYDQTKTFIVFCLRIQESHKTADLKEPTLANNGTTSNNKPKKPAQTNLKLTTESA